MHAEKIKWSLPGKIMRLIVDTARQKKTVQREKAVCADRRYAELPKLPPSHWRALLAGAK
jgi:hypothetical protein